MSVRNRLGAAATVAILALTGLVVVSELYVSIPLVPTMQRLFGVSQTQASWLGTAFGLAYAGGFLVFGPLSDRYGRKTIMVPGLFALALSTLAVGFSPSYEVLVGLRIVQGIAAATFAPAALAYLGEVLPASSRATGIAVVTTGFLVAGIVGQVYADAVTLAVGWEWVFWGLAAVYGAFVVLLYVLPQSAGAAGESATSLRTVYARMGRLLQNRVLLAAYFAAFTLLFTFVGMYSGLAPYLQTTFGIGPEQLLLVRVAGIPGMVLSPLAGRLVARYGSARVVISGLILAAGGLGLEAVAGSLTMLVIGSVVFVTGIAAAVPSLISFVGETAASARGAAVALYMCILFIGASLGPLVATYLQPIGFVGLCGVLAVVLLFAAGVLALGRNGTAPQLADDPTPRNA
ncbi:MFS transporter [Natrialba aegyptia]|uniref:TcaB protein n=1 Tax=Natrialba aegyptia DSM 13077 TaxID=1227491 RepID=M0AN54_9EURY|nr:MFS transporter [Natrialba aegyptia]ELY99944.1 TcaB protein [Natrialba aegyptia DSM 13077]